jgi:hypothetical protein
VVGSCASGLALHDAPVDIVVTGLLAPDSCCGTGAASSRHTQLNLTACGSDHVGGDTRYAA